MSISSIFSKPADEFVNDPEVEKLWTIKAVTAMRVHFNLLSSVPPQELNLTRKDDFIYKRFRESFPDLEISRLKEDDLKSDESKAKWRPFCEEFKDEVEDYNFASLLRIDSSKDYSDENTLVAPRIQFLAIEIARNREGFNNAVFESRKKAEV